MLGTKLNQRDNSSVSTYCLQSTIAIPAVNGAVSPQQSLELLWAALTDFPNWQQWLPDTSSIELVDADPAARGTHLNLHSNRGSESWEISYWDPVKRMVFQIQKGSRHSACAFEIRHAGEDALELTLEFEMELTGFRRLFGPILNRMQLRHTRRLEAALQSWLVSRLQ